jgi:hypothetical protein
LTSAGLEKAGADATPRFQIFIEWRMMMGQAKQRGTRQEREAQAQARIASLKPKKLVCDNCGAKLPDFETMDLHGSGLVGIHAVFAAECSCGYTSWTVVGETGAAADLLATMRKVAAENEAMSELMSYLTK